MRGGDGAATVTPTRARSRKRWIHAKGKPTAATGPLLLGKIELIILRKKIEDWLIFGAFFIVPRECGLWWSLNISSSLRSGRTGGRQLRVTDPSFDRVAVRR